MSKVYTFDKKLLTGCPAINIDGKYYAVDDREKTVRKAMELFRNTDKDTFDFEKKDELFRLAFGDKCKEIEKLDLSFAASQELMSLVISAMTGTNTEESEDSFQV